MSGPGEMHPHPRDLKPPLEEGTIVHLEEVFRGKFVCIYINILRLAKQLILTLLIAHRRKAKV